MAAGDWKDMLLASQTGNLDLVKYYIRQGVNINYQHPKYLTTPLIESIENEHPAIVQLLLQNGADLGFSTDTPLIVALRTKHKAIIKMLRPYAGSWWNRLQLFFKNLC